ncbi:hypothetical protein EH240_21625 [Mesorhizobium tamadayense]|uniref:Uncharacterized protein n=1 Tax=Mesorhizobium tamadayense TaxID=425306 RepID=A0A3P3FFN8_9HYPH|nr:hypothetical protein EH240_21625 [Mesorhizobium tamadayense]
MQSVLSPERIAISIRSSGATALSSTSTCSIWRGRGPGRLRIGIEIVRHRYGTIRIETLFLIFKGAGRDRGARCADRDQTAWWFTEEQIIAVLREDEAGAKTGHLARKQGVSEFTLYTERSSSAASPRRQPRRSGKINR